MRNQLIVKWSVCLSFICLAPQLLAAESTTRDCKAIKQRFCTMEFQPVRCEAGGKVVEGENPCRGKLKLEYQACLANEFIDVKPARDCYNIDKYTVDNHNN